MKRFVVLPLFAFLLTIFITACGNSPSSSNSLTETTKNQTVKIATVDNPQFNSILEIIKDDLKKEGVNLEVIYMTDWNLFNQSLANKEVDINFFQHQNFLNNANKTNGWNLQAIAKTYMPMKGFYSSKYTSIEELPDKATITVPSDPVNNGHALYLLDKQGLIKLKESVGYKGSQKDIIENAHQYKIVEVDSLMLPQVFKDSDLTHLTGPAVTQVGQTPEDALILGEYIESFSMVVAAREDNKDDEAIQKVAKAFESSEVKKMLLEKYSNEIIWP